MDYDEKEVKIPRKKEETICNYLKLQDETEMYPKTIFILMILF